MERQTFPEMFPSPGVFPVNEDLGDDHYNMMCSDVFSRCVDIATQYRTSWIRHIPSVLSTGICNQMNITPGRARAQADERLFEPRGTLSPKSSARPSHFFEQRWE
jgi:hypothetical protein